MLLSTQKPEKFLPIKDNGESTKPRGCELDNIRIFGLSRLDSLDLKKQFPDAEIVFEAGATKDPHHGELATAALVAVSLAGLQALAAWLLKNRKGNRIQKVVEVVKPDGS